MRTLHSFESWDKVDADVKHFRRQANMSEKFEITAWGFADYGQFPPMFWHRTDIEELCFIPAGVWVAVISEDRIDDFFEVDFWTDISRGIVE